MRSKSEPSDDAPATQPVQMTEDTLSTDERNQAIDALTQEIAALSNSMQENLQAADKGIAAAGALIITGLGVALLHKATIVLIALPYGLGVVFFYTLQKFAERLSAAGLRRYLENMLQCISKGKSPVMQQRVADYWHRRRHDETAANVLYGIVGLAAVSASLYVANQQTKLPRSVPLADWLSSERWFIMHTWRFTGLTYFDAMFLVILLVALYFPFRTMDQAYKIALKAAETRGSDRA
jgi:hypothetical protein